MKEKTPKILEFLKIYPEFILNIEHNEKDELIKYFNIINKIKRKKLSMVYNSSQIKNLMEQQKKTDIYSLNFDNKEVLSIEKIVNRNEKNKENKIIYKVIQKEEDVEKYIDKSNEDFFLINKGIEEQNRNIKRTQDVKKAIGLFIEKSELIQKLLKNYGINENKSSLGNKTIIERNKNKIAKLISNLADNVILRKYEKGKFVIRKYDIGTDCYFLLSGRLSILKTIEYKNIKISYENYFKYLLNLIEKKEDKIFEYVVKINMHFIKVYNEENLIEIIKYYIQKRISFYSNISDNFSEIKNKEDLTLDNIESFISEYKLKVEDFGLSKEKILSDIKEIKIDRKADETKLILNNYFRNIFKIDKNKEKLFKQYDFLFQKQETEKNKYVTLYKYETFLILSPGAFFGEMSIDSENKRRNASIRAETDCIVASLSLELYSNLLLDENKKILIRQINFIHNNYFFNNISPKIFEAKFFTMFKLINFSKENIIYEQGSNCDSIFFINDGTIKYEMNASITEIHNLIYFLLSELENHEEFKLNNQIFEELKLAYMKNQNLIKIKEDKQFLMKKINNKQKFELGISEHFEVLGLPELFFEIPYITKCSVVSFNVRLFELSKYNLNQIITSQQIIKKDLYKLLCEKIIIFIKRLFNIENNYLKYINNKLDNNALNVRKSFTRTISWENINLIERKKSNNKDCKEEGKKDINENEDSILIKQFSISGKTNYNNKKIFYSPLKYNKKIINKKFFSEINKFNYSQSNPNLKRKYYENIQNTQKNISPKETNLNTINNLIREKKINNKFSIQDYKEKIDKKADIGEYENIFMKNKFNKEKINVSLSNPNRIKKIISLNNSVKIKDPKNQTIINTGKDYILLPKLKKLFFLIQKRNEQKLSIVNNDLSQKSDMKENILFNENENIIKGRNKMLYSNSLPTIPRQYTFRYLPLRRKIDKRKRNKSTQNEENMTKMSRFNDENKNNILAKYIKNYYNNQKSQGISSFLNTKFNTIIKKKMNKSLENKRIKTKIK